MMAWPIQCSKVFCFSMKIQTTSVTVYQHALKQCSEGCFWVSVWVERGCLRLTMGWGWETGTLGWGMGWLEVGAAAAWLLGIRGCTGAWRWSIFCPGEKSKGVNRTLVFTFVMHASLLHKTRLSFSKQMSHEYLNLTEMVCKDNLWYWHKLPYSQFHMLLKEYRSSLRLFSTYEATGHLFVF